MQSAQPPQNPAPYGARPGQEMPYQVGGGTQPPSGRPSAGWWVAAGAVALVFLVGGFFIGTTVEKNKYEAGKPAYDGIYNVGYAAGHGEGSYEGEKAGEDAGKKKGKKEGEEIGYHEGKSAGLEEGEIKGTEEGASAALGGLGGWDPAANYIINVTGGPSSEVPFVISRRSEMVKGEYYSLCQQNPKQVCVHDQR